MSPLSPPGTTSALFPEHRGRAAQFSQWRNEMKAAISVLWLIFVGIFLHLGLQHLSDAKRGIPPFPTPERKELSRIGNIQIAGQDLDKPIKDFVTGFNDYLTKRNESNRDANRRSAWGYFMAALTAFVSMFIEWRGTICDQFRKPKSSESGQQRAGEPTSDPALVAESDAAQR